MGIKSAGMSIYELHALQLNERRCPDWSYKTSIVELGYYSSVEEAEKMIGTVIARAKDGKWPNRVFAFYVGEHALDQKHHGRFDELSRFESIRSYYPDGTLNCFSDYDDACVKPFKGRDAKTIRYGKGDVVLVYGRHARVYPAIVGAPPFSKEEYGRRFKRRVVRGHALSPHDYSDDCYLTFSVWGHDHPPCVNVFPFKGTLPEDVLRKMKREGAEFFCGTGEQ